jgi:hypothetical protein
MEQFLHFLAEQIAQFLGGTWTYRLYCFKLLIKFFENLLLFEIVLLSSSAIHAGTHCDLEELNKKK